MGTGSDADTTPNPLEVALYHALLSLCDYLPGEPPTLIAWAPGPLAERLTAQLTAQGWEVAQRT